MASGVSEANEAQRQRPGVQGQCPGGDSEPDKVIFNVYNIIRMVTFGGGNITECSYRGVWNDIEGRL